MIDAFQENGTKMQVCHDSRPGTLITGLLLGRAIAGSGVY
jgi:hypothetical protein